MKKSTTRSALQRLANERGVSYQSVWQKTPKGRACLKACKKRYRKTSAKHKEYNRNYSRIYRQRKKTSL